MEALRVRAVLGSGRVATIDGFLPLDGILAAAWMRREHPDLFYDVPAGRLRTEIIDADLPLERRELHGQWFFACSFAQFRSLGEELDHWHKRFDDREAAARVDFQGRRGRIHVQSGYYKTYRVPFVYLIVPELVWYLVGNRSEVERLLLTMAAIGKKTGMGFGDVAEWIIEPWPRDWSCCDAQGRLTRALPTKDGPDYGGIRPPYWHPSNQTWCQQPRPGGPETP